MSPSSPETPAVPRTLTSSELQAYLLDSLIDSQSESIYFKDEKSRFIRVNNFMANHLGISSPGDFIGKTDFDFFQAEHAQPAFDAERLILQTGRPILDTEEKETHADGKVTWVSTSKYPLKTTSGEIIGTFGISRDITARKEAEHKLEDTKKELVEASRLAGMAEISSGVLHNIGNALNAVSTSTSLLSDIHGRSRLPNLGKAMQLMEQNLGNLPVYLSDDAKGKQLPGYLIQLTQNLLTDHEQAKKELELLKKNIEHIKEVISMQQNYARSSHQTEEVTASDLVEEALRISEASLNRHGISVLKEFSEVPTIRVARHKVLQILVNFIRNAKHALDDSGRSDKELRIRLRKAEDGFVQFQVLDNGVGIAPEHQKMLFTFGFTTRKHGHGFGLHSSVGAARDLGGRIRGESAGPGQGACFTLEIPAS